MRRKSQLLLLLATVLGVAVLGMAPVFAESNDATDTSGDTNTSTTSGDTSNQTTSDNSTETDTSTNTETETEVNTLEKEAKDKLVEMRQHGSEHSVLARQRSCEARQKSIDTRISNFSAAAQRHQDVFTSIFTKVQAFYTKNNLNVANYDTLVATVNTKQTASQQAVSALKALDVTTDCKASDPAQQVQTLKTAVSNARTALQAYRAAIKDLVVALEGASTAHDNTSTGGAQ